MFLLTLAIAQAAVAQPIPKAPDGDRSDIVVTGRRYADAQRRLADCLARNCPPREEIARSLAYADQQFIAGDYKGSRETLLAARRRNARYAATLPREVADLHRANARLAGLNGLTDPAQIGAIDAVDALKKGLPTDDPAVMLQRLEVGDAFATNGQLDEALDQYRQVAGRAKKAHLPSVEGMAMFRSAVLLAGVASVRPSYDAEARKAVAAIEARPEPDFLPFRNGVRIMAVRLAAAKDKDALMEKAIATLERAPGDQEPILVHNPPIDMQDAAFGAVAGNDKPQWADVGFRITPDGKVADVSTLRSSPHLEEQWLDVATRSLKQRRYQPLALPPGAPGVFKVERYSFVGDLAVGKDSRIPVCDSRRRVDVMDLTLAPKP